MKKKYQDLNGRNDDSFKKVKLNIQDILKILKRIFNNKVNNYQDLNGTHLQTRVRDYVIEIQPSVIMETSGLGFLEIVRREANLVRNMIEKDLALSANTEDLFREKYEDDKDIHQMQENFYGMNDFMGHQYHHLPEGYVKGVKKYQMYQKMGDERANPKLREGGSKYEPENKAVVKELEELSFDDIYETIHDKQMDREFMDLIKNLQKMENKSQTLEHDISEIPTFQEYVDELNQEIIKKLQERYEKMMFMRQMMIKLNNHYEQSGEILAPGDQEIGEDVETEEHFYLHFPKDIAGILFGVKKTERHTIAEYYTSSNKSRFQRTDGQIYEYDLNKRKSPKKGQDKEHENNSEYDYDYENDEDYLQDSEDYNSKKKLPTKKKNLNKVQSEDEEDDDDDDDRYLDRYENAIKQNTTTNHKENLRQRRNKNESNSRARNQKIANKRRHDQAESDEEDNDKYKDNLGRLADYVKSSEYQKRKDLETGSVSSGEDGDVEFKNTKQKNNQVKYDKIKRTPASEGSSDEENSQGVEEFEDSYDKLPHLKNSNQNSSNSSKNLNFKNSKGNQKKNVNIQGDSDEEEQDDDYSRNSDLLDKLKQETKTRNAEMRNKKPVSRVKNNERRLPKFDTKTEKHKLPDKRSFRENDLPPPVQGLDSSKYENLIYKTKKRTMYIAMKDFRPKDRNYFPMRQGDILCSVQEIKGWSLVYVEENPKKFGFVPSNYLNVIH